MTAADMTSEPSAATAPSATPAPDAAHPPTVLCVAGSPRRHGNSDRMLDALAEGVEQAGGSAVTLVLAELAIAPCNGCGACSVTGSCTIRDDMDEVLRLADAASAIAIASPVYFASVPAGVKALLDRCQPYWARRYVLNRPGPAKRPAALLLAGGGGDPFGTECAVTPVRSALAVLGFALREVLDVTDVDKPSDVSSRPEVLDRARAIGRLLVQTAEGSQ